MALHGPTWPSQEAPPSYVARTDRNWPWMARWSSLSQAMYGPSGNDEDGAVRCVRRRPHAEERARARANRAREETAGVGARVAAHGTPDPGAVLLQPVGPDAGPWTDLAPE